jgi:hypothetical protein
MISTDLEALTFWASIDIIGDIGLLSYPRMGLQVTYGLGYTGVSCKDVVVSVAEEGNPFIPVLDNSTNGSNVTVR